MKPLSNKVNLALLILGLGLLGYFLIALLTVSIGMLQLVGSIYLLYISIIILVLTVIGIAFSIWVGIKWSLSPKTHNGGR